MLQLFVLILFLTFPLINYAHRTESTGHSMHKSAAKRLAKPSLIGIWENPEMGIIMHIKRDKRGYPKLAGYYDIAHLANSCVLDRYNTTRWQYFWLNVKKIEVSQDKLYMTTATVAEPDVLMRLPRLPQACQHPLTSHRARDNFNFLWNYYQEYYPEFAERLNTGMSWNAIKSVFAGKIAPNIENYQFYLLLSDMLAMLHDGHVNLWYGSDPDIAEVSTGDADGRNDISTFRGVLEKQYHVPHFEPRYDVSLRHSIYRLHHVIDHRYLVSVHHALPQSLMGSHPVITWGLMRKNNGIGYFRITQELALALNDDDDTDEVQLFDQAIDDAMRFFKKKGIHALIIDDRINFGGDDYVGRRICGYLTDRKRLAYQNFYHYKKQWSQPENSYIVPRQPSLYNADNPLHIVVMGSPLTYSAGENFIGMLSTLPNTLNVGYNTFGIYAEMTTRQLPNGWLFSVPMGKIVMANGKFYGGTGIPADVAIPPEKNFLSKEYLSQQQDIVLDKALEILNDNAHPWSISR